jgi:hypothetical protein
MDWQLVIDRNRTALLAIIVALVASLGLTDGGRLTALPRFVYAQALAVLRAAKRDPIHEVLADCHSLARLARDGP